ncbi:hypothetical protein [Leeuwenhoekiella sp.]|uniref:hypothetical protein n=1 Tax=Leeuwenhoekiella sp. TaxID=1977054 RepID=UPI000C489E57|nr:hypothetical protein [Leeuwenhoekiella sp.]MBA82682.1 hypothetical protein [Leeuwenhoekiella sp.]|tara:strand:- start:476 stop:760 length:285 start_codon:yes stop_codon:yes gene_type:complete
MSYQLQKEFPDYSRRNNKGYFYVNPDKSVNPYNKELYPLTFTGYLNGENVKIILNSHNSDFIDSYEFVSFPDSAYADKEDVIGWIHQFINKEMD